MITNHIFFRRRRAVLIALLLLMPILSSCLIGNSPDTSAVLSEMQKTAGDLPAGNTYTTKSTPGAHDHLSESLLTALYGTNGYPEVFGRAESISLWISSGLHACEFAVFLCSNRRDTEEIADLCLGRIDTMQHFVNANSAKLSLEEASSANLKEATVAVVGRYVIMAVSSDAKSAVSAAKEMIS